MTDLTCHKLDFVAGFNAEYTCYLFNQIQGAVSILGLLFQIADKANEVLPRLP